MSDKITCGRHGETPVTFVCCHVVNGSGLGFCLPLDSSETWPDAVCHACADEQPEWTEEQEVDRIRLLCTECWEDALERNHAVPTTDDTEWLHDMLHRAIPRQNAWTKKFGINDFKKYHYSFEGDEPWLGFGDTEAAKAVRCTTFPIGSWSRRKNTWMWSWANESWDAATAGPALALKRLGEQKGYRHLRRSFLGADEETAWQLASLAITCLPEVDGIYRSPSENGALFLAARRTRRVV